MTTFSLLFNVFKLRIGVAIMLSALAGLAVLLPDPRIALPAGAIGLGLIILHRYFGGTPSLVDTAAETDPHITHSQPQ